MHVPKKLAAAGAAIAATAVLAACGAGADAAPAGDPATSGSITVYTALDHDLIDLLIPAFNAEFPDIDVTVVRESTGVITARVISESANPQADVLWATAVSSMLVLDDMDLLVPFTPEGLDRILPAFRDPAEVPAWVGNSAWETAFIVNLPELEGLGLSIEDIQDYDDLLRPELQGHVVMPNPASSGTGFLTVTALLQLNGRETEVGWDLMAALHENIGSYTTSGAAPAVQAGMGETVIGISYGFAGQREINRGAPVALVFPASGSGWDMESSALLYQPNREINPAAKTFLDWTISDGFMDIIAEYYMITAIGTGMATEPGQPNTHKDQLIENDFAWAAANRDAILERWTAAFDSGS